MSDTTGHASVAAGGNTVAGGATLAAATSGATTGGATQAGGGSTVAGGAQTALNTGTTVAGASNTTAAWRDDWRQAFATVDGVVDAKMLRLVERYQSPEAVAAAYASLRTRMDGGDYIAKLPADAKPEEIAAWRTQNGIPAEAAGYLKTLPDTIKIPETDKANVGKFFDALHAQNAPPGTANAALDAYYKIVADTAATRAEADKALTKTTLDLLNVEWGADFRGNMNAIQGLIDSAPEGARAIAGARLPDGTMAMSSPAVLRWLGQLALAENPAASIIPGSGASAGKGVDDRIAEIEGVMRTDRRAYDKDGKMHAEYLKLLDARERNKARAA
jgi:hypothetical protein